MIRKLTQVELPENLEKEILEFSETYYCMFSNDKERETAKNAGIPMLVEEVFSNFIIQDLHRWKTEADEIKKICVHQYL